MILGIHHFSIIASSEESVKFYEKLGLKDLARNAIVNYSHNALDLLHETKMDFEAYKVFEGIINRLVDREK